MFTHSITSGLAKVGEGGEAAEEGQGAEEESQKRKRDAFPPGLSHLVRPDAFAFPAAAPLPPPAAPPPPPAPPRSRRPAAAAPLTNLRSRSPPRRYSRSS